jgi:hypothetical protein
MARPFILEYKSISGIPDCPDSKDDDLHEEMLLDTLLNSISALQKRASATDIQGLADVFPA